MNKTQKYKTLFIDLGGSVVCYEHLGAYGRAEVDRYPNRTTFNTVLTEWERVSVAEASKAGLSCESCEEAEADAIWCDCADPRCSRCRRVYYGEGADVGTF